MNFLQWSQLVLMFASGKGKDDYLTREKQASPKEYSKYKTWRSENSMVIVGFYKPQI